MQMVYVVVLQQKTLGDIILGVYSTPAKARARQNKAVKALPTREVIIETFYIDLD
jgi:hypothetical protein